MIETTPSTSVTTTTVELLGKPYQIRCQENEVPALQKAAQHLNETLKAMPNISKMLAPERLGIMAALNLTSQLLDLEQQMSQHVYLLNQRLANLQGKIENALNPAPYVETDPATQI